MSVLTYTEITELAQREAQVFVASGTDPAFTAADLLVHANSAYQMIYEESGGSIVTATGATVWTSGGVASTATDFIKQGGSTTAEIADAIQVWASLITGSTGDEAAAIPLKRVDISEINTLRSMSGVGTYSTPKLYAIVRRSPFSSDTTTNLYDLYWWPSVVGYFFPIQYKRQFDPFDGGASDVPDVNDIESYDMAYALGAVLAPLGGRSELVPSIISKISREMQPKIIRRLSASFAATQDK